MARKYNLQRKRFQNANRWKFRRSLKKEKNKMNSEMFKLLNETTADVEGTTENQNQQSSAEERRGLHTKLRMWALKYNVQTSCMRDLLQMLRNIGVPFLPKDPRTLLHTPKQINVENIANGKFWYSGIANKLRQKYQSTDKSATIELNFHVDGLQLFQSSSKQFWPILGQIHGKNSDPFVVAVWLGISKPSCVNEYLAKFVDEMNDLTSNGIEISGVQHRVKLRAIIGDTPARCFLKGIKIYTSADITDIMYE